MRATGASRGGGVGRAVFLNRQAIKRNGQTGSFSIESALKIGDRPTDVDDNGNRKVVVGK